MVIREIAGDRLTKKAKDFMGRKKTDLDFEKYDKLKETYGEGTNPYLPKKDAYAMSKMRKEIMKAIPKNFRSSEEPGKRV